MNDTIKNDAATHMAGAEGLAPGAEPQGHGPSTEFLARRRAKNFAVLALIFGLVAVIFIMTILKMQAGAS